MNTTKPTLIHVVAWTTLASGIVNLFWGLAATGTFLASIIGFVCIPLTILPTIFGIFELIYAAKLFSDPPQILRPSTNIAVFEIASILTGNAFSMAVGILSLVFYNDAVVKDYFARLNGEVSTEPAISSTPLLESIPTPEPVEQEPEEKPSPPKRAPRKTAKK